MKKAADGAEKQRKILHVQTSRSRLAARQAAERQKLRISDRTKDAGVSIQQFEQLRLE